MPTYTTTGSAYYEVLDNADAPWTLRIDGEYDISLQPFQLVPRYKDPEVTGEKLNHIHLYRRFEEEGPWEPVPWDFLNHQHWEPVIDLAHNFCRDEALRFSLIAWDYDRDRSLDLHE